MAFRPTTGIEATAPTMGLPESPVASGPDFTDRLRMSQVFQPQESLYNPQMYTQPSPVEMPATESYMELLGERPDYEGPGMLRKVAASMVALNDPRLAMAALQQPDQELVDWQGKVDAAQKGAEAEQVIRQMQERARGTDVDIFGAQTRAGRLLLDMDKFAQELTPEEEHALELEKINLRGENAMEQIQARADAARQQGDARHAQVLEQLAQRAADASALEGQRQTGRMTLEEERQKRPQRAGSQTDTQRRRDQANRAMSIIRNDPIAAAHVEVDPTTGEVSIADVGAGRLWGGDPELTQEKYNELYDAIFNPDAATNVPQAAAPPTGRVVVMKDGQQFTVPAEQLEQAIAEGYTKVE